MLLTNTYKIFYIIRIGAGIMNTKLTLSIKDSVIHQAKAYAKKQGVSLSYLVESYLSATFMPCKKKKSTKQMGAMTQQLMGIAKTKKKLTKPDDEVLTDELIEKYL